MKSKYIDETTLGKYDVVFISKGERLVRKFNSLYMAIRFARKVEHSKRLTLVSAPFYE